MELKDKIFIALMLITYAFLFKQIIESNEFPDMIKIEINTPGAQVTTIYTDQDGIVRHCDQKEWLDRVVIDVKSLKKGLNMQYYDLFSDVIGTQECMVKSIDIP